MTKMTKSKKDRRGIKPETPKLAASSRELKLDLGCGQNVREGFEGVDLYGDKAKHKVDLFKFPWPFKDGSVDEINCSHFMEHIPAREIEARDLVPLGFGDHGSKSNPLNLDDVCVLDGVKYLGKRFIGQDMFFAFLDECYRILKPGGWLFFVVPSGRSDSRLHGSDPPPVLHAGVVSLLPVGGLARVAGARSLPPRVQLHGRRLAHDGRSGSPARPGGPGRARPDALERDDRSRRQAGEEAEAHRGGEERDQGADGSQPGSSGRADRSGGGGRVGFEYEREQDVSESHPSPEAAEAHAALGRVAEDVVRAMPKHVAGAVVFLVDAAGHVVSVAGGMPKESMLAVMRNWLTRNADRLQRCGERLPCGGWCRLDAGHSELLAHVCVEADAATGKCKSQP